MARTFLVGGAVPTKVNAEPEKFCVIIEAASSPEANRLPAVKGPASFGFTLPARPVSL